MFSPGAFIAVLAQATTTTTVAPCGPPEEAGAVCSSIYSITGNEALAQASNAVIVMPARIGLIVVMAFIGTRLVRRAVRRSVRGVRNAQADIIGGERSPGTLLRTSPGSSPRAAQRAETIGSLMISVTTVAIWTIATFMVFGELGLAIGPLLTGAGIVGIALGFGAQNLVRDFLSGVFMLIEDQYGVGDVINAGPATGVVEGVSLRTTRLRDVEGNVWHIPNGSIERIANMSQQWSRSLLDIGVAYGTDIDRATAVIKQVAVETWRDPKWVGEILEEPEVWGVERFEADGIAIRLVTKTRPLSQWKIGRELRARIKQAFDREGIEIPVPQRVVWHRDGNGHEPNGPGNGQGPGPGPGKGSAQDPGSTPGSERPQDAGKDAPAASRPETGTPP